MVCDRHRHVCPYSRVLVLRHGRHVNRYAHTTTWQPWEMTGKQNDRLAWWCLDITVVTSLPVHPYVSTGTWQGHDQACLHQRVVTQGHGRYTNSAPHASRWQHRYTENIGTTHYSHLSSGTRQAHEQSCLGHQVAVPGYRMPKNKCACAAIYGRLRKSNM